jgi:hypothetical protein
MGFRDVETRKLNKEMQIKGRHHDLFKEAEGQSDVITSTGANLDKFGIGGGKFSGKDETTQKDSSLSK